MNYIEQLGKAAKASKKSIATAGTAKKNEILEKIAENLRKNIDVILKENEKDTAKAKENGITDAMVDRLRLTPERISRRGYRGLHQTERYAYHKDKSSDGSYRYYL